MGRVQLTPASVIRFAPGARVFARGRGVLQFGIDATRSGIVETPLADALVPALSLLTSPVTLGEVLGALAGADMDPAAARALIDDLAAFRIVVADSSPRVLLMGRGPLADALSALLRSAHISVRTPLPTEPAARTLHAVDPHMPIVFVDQLHRYRDLAKSARHLSSTMLPVSAVDARVYIGPVGAGRSGPCLYCAHLYHADRDDQWEHVVAPHAGGQASADPGTDPVVVAAGAAAAATVVRRICGVPDPPGVSAPPPERGMMVVADPFGPTPLARTVLGPHQGCPVCY